MYDDIKEALSNLAESLGMVRTGQFVVSFGVPSAHAFRYQYGVGSVPLFHLTDHHSLVRYPKIIESVEGYPKLDIDWEKESTFYYTAFSSPKDAVDQLKPLLLDVIKDVSQKDHFIDSKQIKNSQSLLIRALQ